MKIEGRGGKRMKIGMSDQYLLWRLLEADGKR